MSLKTLAKLALQRDRRRDKQRDKGHETAPILSHSGGAVSEPQRDKQRGAPWTAELVATPEPGEPDGAAALALLARAEAAGLTLKAAGDRLLITAPVPPDPALLHALAGAKRALLELLRGDPDALAERLAIMAEPRLPPLGTPARERMDRDQARMVAGLLRAANARG